jgi:hypothetical protein
MNLSIGRPLTGNASLLATATKVVAATTTTTAATSFYTGKKQGGVDEHR